MAASASSRVLKECVGHFVDERVTIASWRDLLLTNLRIGILGFGGPQAHIAMLREQIVDQHHWVNAEQFDEGLGLCEALPGPASSQMAIYLGWLQKGWLGGLISGSCFLLPGLLIVLVLSELWRSGQSIPSFTTALQTVQPVIAAIVWAFAWKLMKNRRHRWQRLTALLVMFGVMLNMLGFLPLTAGWLLLLAGVARLPFLPPSNVPPTSPPALRSLLAPLGFALTTASSSAFVGQLFMVFFKTGLLVFGGGLVIIPLLEQQIVDLGWLSSAQFLDGVAIGQISPGPVVLTSTFVGYQAGWAQGGLGMALLGAATATIGIFLPSFGFILLASPLLQRWRQHPTIKGVLNGLLAGVPGAVAAAAASLTLTTFEVGNTLVQILLFVGALVGSVSGRLKPIPLIVVAIGIGLALEWIG